VSTASHNSDLEAASSDAAFNPSGLSLAEPSDFFALMKPRVMSLVVFTAWVGLVLAPNMVAAGLLAFTIFFYLVIYTMWLKRSTPQNIVIGGAAGAFPPMIGWAAITGDITLNSVLLLTRNQIMGYSVALAVIAIAPIFTGLAGNLYAAFAVLLNIGYLALAFKVWTSRAGEIADSADEASLYEVKAGDRAARNLFAYSIIYLFATFGVLAAEALLANAV